jgi:site-specific DNA recombinase
MTLHYLLKSPLYIGKISYKDELFDGEHAAIVDLDLWQMVQAKLASNSRQGNHGVRNKLGALLRGLLHCSACDAPMLHTFSSKKRNRQYRYYVCSSAKKHGAATCPLPSVPAEELEQFVVRQIKQIGQDDVLLAETIAQAQRHAEESVTELRAEQKRLGRELASHNADLISLASGASLDGNDERTSDRIAELQERIATVERRAGEVRDRLVALGRRKVDDHEVAAALRVFDPTWEALASGEKARIMHLLIERIDFNGGTGDMRITFRDSGIEVLTGAANRHGEGDK